MFFGSLSSSVTVTETVSSSVVTSSRPGDEDEEEQALLERLAKREERRQRRMKEALDRQKEIESSQTSHYDLEESGVGLRRGRGYDAEEEVNSKEVEKEEDIPREETEEVVEKPRRSYLSEQVCSRSGFFYC